MVDTESIFINQRVNGRTGGLRSQMKGGGGGGGKGGRGGSIDRITECR